MLEVWLTLPLSFSGTLKLPALLPELSFLQRGEGDYDQSKTKVLHLSLNPAGAARQRLREDQQQLQEECERLWELARALEAGSPVPAHLEAAAGLPSSREVAELKKQVESAELKKQRLKEVFQTKIQEFRKVCYTLTGYQVDITTENKYRLTSMYAEQKADCLIFKAAGPSGTKMQLLETAFYYDPRAWQRKGQESEIARLQIAVQNLHSANTL